jgi:hypothetical protein
MSDAVKEGKVFTFKPEAVKHAFTSLLKASTHEQILGYLAVLRSQSQNGGQPATSKQIKEFFDEYLSIDGGPPDTYIRPLASGDRSEKPTERWFSNKNVAGSYAPSSLRQESPFKKVVEVNGKGGDATYSLRADHSDAAFSNLFQSTPLPVTALVVFLYRDFGFELSEPQISKVIEAFRDESGLREDVEVERKAFEKLFYDDSNEYPDDTLVEFEGVNE